jgi:peptidoglycan/xylan/chitin deacetylase (PgdA/CDA1 family)
VSRLPILMYHHIAETKSEGLTISAAVLEAQFKFLAENGYHTYHFNELLTLKELPSKKNVMITFDDGFVSQLSYAVPLLKKYKLKATFFITLKHIGKTDAWNSGEKEIMTPEMLHSLDSEVIELAHHSYEHKKYDELSFAEIEEDTKKSFQIVSENALEFTTVLAYPYGNFPRNNPDKDQFVNLLKNHQFRYGLRIGNRVNKFPFKNRFMINRIDVKGEFSLSVFKRKLKWGKLI